MPFFVLIAGVDFGAASNRSRSMASLSNNIELIIWVVIAMVALWAGLNFWTRYRDKILRSSDSPQSLFLELCSVHRLSRTEKSLLMEAANAAHLTEPAIAFVNPQVLGGTTGSASANSQERRVLAEKLFGRESEK